jgi:hypothetical protein
VNDATNTTQIQTWINSDPSNLSEAQIDAIYVANISDSNLSEKVNTWREWQSGGDQPTWFGSSESGNESEVEQTSGADSNGDSDSKTVAKQMTDEVYISEYSFDADEETVTIDIVNDGDDDETVHVTDSWSMFYSERIITESVEVGAGETVTITSSAMLEEQLQVVTVQVAGNVQSAVPLRSEQSLPWEDEPSQWDYVWAFGGAIVVAGIVAIILVAVYIHLKSKRESFNSFDKLHDRL